MAVHTSFVLISTDLTTGQDDWRKHLNLEDLLFGVWRLILSIPGADRATLATPDNPENSPPGTGIAIEKPFLAVVDAAFYLYPMSDNGYSVYSSAGAEIAWRRIKGWLLIGVFPVRETFHIL
jgi:hypothetical protein